MTTGGRSPSTTKQAGSLLYAIQEASDALEDRLAPIAADVGLTMPQFRLLYYVVESGPMRLSDLARRRRCVKSNISNLVRGMEREGLLTLRPSPSDRRARLVTATRTGASAYRKAARLGRKLELELVQRLGEKAATRLEDLSMAAAGHLDEGQDDA